MQSNRRVRVGSMLRLPELSGPNRYVWHHVLFTVSKSYLREPPLLLLRGAESLWGEDTMKCPLWITWVQGRVSAEGPVPATRAGSPSAPSESESEESWSRLRPVPLPAIVRCDPGLVDCPSSSGLSPPSYSSSVVSRLSSISSNAEVWFRSRTEAPHVSPHGSTARVDCCVRATIIMSTSPGGKVLPAV